MRAHLRIKTPRPLEPVGGGKPTSTHPPGDAADAFKIGHDIIGGAGRERRSHGRALGKILSDLDRRLEFTHEPRVAGIVIVTDRLFEPIDALLIERAPALERLSEAERLIVIDHYGDLAADALLHRMERDEIILKRWIAKPELDRAEAADKEFLRLVRQLFRRHQPESAGIIGANPLGRAAEERHKRATSRDRQGVP